MRSTGQYATFRGRQYRTGSRGVDADGHRYVGLTLPGADPTDVAEFDRVVVRSTGDRLGVVGVDRLDAYEDVLTTGRYDGQEVMIYGNGIEVVCEFIGDQAWAERHGFEGSQHDGWHGVVPLAEISDIEESVTDLLASS